MDKVSNKPQARGDSMRKQSLRIGSIVTWHHRGGRATGKIVKIVKKGKLKIPKSRFSLKAELDNPVALIRLIKDDELTSISVGHRLSSLKRKRN